MLCRVLDEINNQFSHFNVCTVYIWEWISNFILLIMIDVSVIPYRQLNLFRLICLKQNVPSSELIIPNVILTPQQQNSWVLCMISTKSSGPSLFFQVTCATQKQYIFAATNLALAEFLLTNTLGENIEARF